MKTEKTKPNARSPRSGITTNHHREDRSSDTSQKNAAAINIIILTGSWAIVNKNIANGGPNARNAQPKNSTNVITETK